MRRGRKDDERTSLLVWWADRRGKDGLVLREAGHRDVAKSVVVLGVVVQSGRHDGGAESLITGINSIIVVVKEECRLKREW